MVWGPWEECPSKRRERPAAWTRLTGHVRLGLRTGQDSVKLAGRAKPDCSELRVE